VRGNEVSRHVLVEQGEDEWGLALPAPAYA
jgi:hypothetical protein